LILAIESMGAVAGWPATTDTWPGAADSEKSLEAVTVKFAR
jgi:hypothetical protein